MLKWLIVMAVAVVVLGLLAPRLAKLGLWRLPGDLRFRRKGRDYYLPITSTILLSLALTLVLRVFRI
jgi:hypothetical protein